MMQGVVEKLGSLLPDATESHADPGVRNAFLAATAIWVFAWYLNMFTMPRVFVFNALVSVEMPMFPGLSSSALASMVVYTFPGLASLFLILSRLNPTRWMAIVVGALLASSALFYHFHVGFFSSAQYVVLFWTSLWILWLGHSFYSDRKSLRFEAEWLVKGAVFLVFVGAAVGKWTGGYWRGEPLLDMWQNIIQQSYYPWLRYLSGHEHIEVIAQYHSRFGAILESLFLLTVFLRFRHFVIALCIMIAGVIATMDYTVGCPMFPMLGIAVGCMLLPERGGACRESLAASSKSFRALITIYGLLSVMVICMSFTPSLQKEWMKQSHLSTESGVVWRAVHLFPKMYSFENKFPYIEGLSEAVPADGESEASSLQRCHRLDYTWVNHYPAGVIKNPYCHQIFMTHQGPVTVVLQSRYRSTCVESRLEFHATIEDGERILRVEVPGSRSDC